MCDFCSKKKPKDWDKLMPKKEFKNDSIASEFNAIIKGDKLMVDYDAYSCDSSFSEEIEIQFCPMCGRSLTKNIKLKCDHDIQPLPKPEDGWTHNCRKCGETWSFVSQKTN